MQTLSAQLKTVKGKKSYGYLPKSVKKTVDEVVDKLEELPEVRECYEQWCALQSEVDSYYHDKPREKKTLSQEKEFRQIKNAVIQEAERIRLGEIAFEDANLAGHDEAEWVRGESNACWELRQIIRDEYLSLADRDGAVEELEWLAERGDTHAQYLMGELFFLVLNCPNADRFFGNWEVSPSVFVDGYSIGAVSKNVVEGLAGPITTNFHRLAVSSIIRDCYS